MNAYIKHISYYLPEKRLTNEELAAIFPTYSIDTLLKKTGIRERRIAADGEIASDMAIKASEMLFSESNVNRSEIDFIILTSQFLDYKTPTTTSIIQEKLQLKKSVGSFDINIGCTGFIYSLSVAKGLIETNQVKNVLLLSADPICSSLHPKDRGSRVLLGDAGSAVLISGREDKGIGQFTFGTDGSKNDMIKMMVGGFRYPYTSNPDLSEVEDEYGNITSPAHFNMRGSDVLEAILESIPNHLKELLSKSNMDIDDIDFFIFHQANAYLLDVLRKINKIPKHKFIVDMEYTGNTVSCTIPIALKNALDKSQIKKGDTVMLVSFGVGMSLASTIVKI